MKEPLILSAIAVPNLPGRVFVESRDYNALSQICSQLSTVYASKGIVLVPLKEWTELLDVQCQDQRIKAESWVRLRRGRNKGDLACVLLSSANSDRVRVAVVPRIPLS